MKTLKLEKNKEPQNCSCCGGEQDVRKGNCRICRSWLKIKNNKHEKKNYQVVI